MKTIGLNNYKFGRKNNWRRWIWNQAARRLINIGKSPKEAIVLYLIGESDIDRDIALSKGFKSYNLFGIDIKSENVSSVRDNNNVGICEDMGKIIANWTGYPKIDLILADFCSGINKKTIRFILDIILSPGINEPCIIGINLYRGRDEKKWQFHETIEGYGKHRARHWFNLFLNKTLQISGNLCTQDEFTISQLKTREELGLTQIHLNDYYMISKPEFFSYKSISKNVVMDSCIFNYLRFFDEIKISGLDKKMIQIIAAAKAVRKRRINQKCTRRKII